jgi:hypothetical protein
VDGEVPRKSKVETGEFLRVGRDGGREEEFGQGEWRAEGGGRKRGSGERKALGGGTQGVGRANHVLQGRCGAPGGGGGGGGGRGGGREGEGPRAWRVDGVVDPA